MRKTVLYYDCFSGISGDMNLGALLDLGVPLHLLQNELEKLGLHGWRLDVRPDARKGINGVKADVVLEDAGSARRGLLRASAKPSAGGHEHRSFSDIRRIIEASGLQESTKEIAIDMFTRLAAAEGKIHNTPPEKVHFHEVGAMDSIIDMVGAAICIDYLKPDLVMAGTVELGGGFVNCQHGKLPVPVPAVTELLKDALIRSGTVAFETTTPTGAAILASQVGEWRSLEGLRILKTGYGVGNRDTEIPNVLRVYWALLDDSSPKKYPGTESPEARILAEINNANLSTNGEIQDLSAALARGTPDLEGLKAGLIECNLDDMSPESHGHVLDLLMEAGAQDAWLSPIVMKKSRSAVQLSVLCDQNRIKDFSDLVLLNTTTLGVRVQVVDKFILQRRSRLYKTSLGDMNVKDGIRNEKVIKRKIEFEDLRSGARKSGFSIQEVERQAWKEIDAREEAETRELPRQDNGRVRND